MRYLLGLFALFPLAVLAQDDPAAPVSADRLQSDVEQLVSFGTRHTLSDLDHPTRGIGAARRWATGEFEAISTDCGDCLEIIHPERVFTGDRIPDGALIRNVVAIQRGSERPDEVVIVQGHIDSRVSDVMDAISDAPGANDNASGTALVLEAARALSQQRYPTTIVYAILSGEEQGLYGGELLADYALEQGWTVKAVLNNDIVGGSCGSDGVCDNAHVRVFSEGVRADADQRTRAAMRSLGGANDSPSRNISRWLAELASDHEDGLTVRQTWRSDRMGRGGDHLPFLDRGLPAIRFSVAIEDYKHQHQDLRLEDGVTYGDTVDEMDFTYLAQVTRLNVRALDKLARAPLPPAPEVDAIMRPDTLVTWDRVPGASQYRIYRRRTDDADWPGQPEATIDVQSAETGVLAAASADNPDSIISASIARFGRILPEVRGDDWIIGVSSVASDGNESPIASAVPGGAFRPLASDPQ